MNTTGSTFILGEVIHCLPLKAAARFCSQGWCPTTVEIDV